MLLVVRPSITQSHNNARRPKRASTCHITFSVFLTPSSFVGWSLTFVLPWGQYSRTCNWHWSEERHGSFLIETDADWIRTTQQRLPFLLNSIRTNLEPPLLRFKNTSISCLKYSITIFWCLFGPQTTKPESIFTYTDISCLLLSFRLATKWLPIWSILSNDKIRNHLVANP